MFCGHNIMIQDYIISYSGRSFLTGLYLGILFLFGALLISGQSDAKLGYYSNIYLTLSLSGGVLGLTRYYKSRAVKCKTFRRILLLLSACLLCFAAGDVIWMYVNFAFNKPVPYPGFSDIFYIIANSLLTISIFFLYSQLKLNILDQKSIFGFLLLSAWGGISWLMMGVHESIAQTPIDTLKTMLDIIYPAIGVFNALLLVSLLVTTYNEIPSRLRVFMSLAITAIIINTITDLLLNYLTSLSPEFNVHYANGGPTDVLYATAIYILALSVMFLPIIDRSRGISQ